MLPIKQLVQYRKNSIVSNFSYLSLLHIFNLLLPLITYPYLIRVLGAELYGLVIFSQSVVAYFQIVINFGFDVSATKRVSLNVKNKKKLSETLFSVMFLKLILFLLCFLILIGLLSLIESFNAYRLLYIYSFLICINELIFPQWYFQGIEKMKYITIINVVSKLLFVILIFVVIHEPDDFLNVALINSVGALTGGCISIYIVLRKHKIPFSLPRKERLVNMFKESLPFFFSRSASVFNAKTNTMIIGSFLGYTEVAYYDLAYKLITILQTPFVLLSQAIYPNVVKTRDMSLIKKIAKYVLGAGVLMTVFVQILAEPIIRIIGGEEMLDAAFVFRIMSIYIPFVGISYLFGASVLVVNGYSKDYNLSVIYSFLFYLILLAFLYLTGVINLLTMAIVFVLPEVFVALYRYYSIVKRRIFAVK